MRSVHTVTSQVRREPALTVRGVWDMPVPIQEALEAARRRPGSNQSLGLLCSNADRPDDQPDHFTTTQRSQLGVPFTHCTIRCSSGTRIRLCRRTFKYGRTSVTWDIQSLAAQLQFASRSRSLTQKTSRASTSSPLSSPPSPAFNPRASADGFA